VAVVSSNGLIWGVPVSFVLVFEDLLGLLIAHITGTDFVNNQTA